MINLSVNSYDIPVIFERFPAGESLVRVDEGSIEDFLCDLESLEPIEVRIYLTFSSNNDIINLMLLVDAVRRSLANYGPSNFSLVMPYLPYQQQDRVCNPGESLSVKVIADIINSLKFDIVYCNDIHSDVGVALINNLVHREQWMGLCGISAFLSPAETILVSPDAGALKKIYKVASKLGFHSVVRADKIRDTMTGKIVNTTVHSGHVGNRDFLIVDDLCIGGTTFLELQKKLSPLTYGKVSLFTTHGIYSNGVEQLTDVFEAVYTSHLMNQSVCGKVIETSFCLVN